jgi:hypothetical protein
VLHLFATDHVGPSPTVMVKRDMFIVSVIARCLFWHVEIRNYSAFRLTETQRFGLQKILNDCEEFQMITPQKRVVY